MNINDATKLKEKLEEKASKGFGYFMKNVGMVILMFIAIFILTNPDCIADPESFFPNFSFKSLWVVFALFLAIAGFYQLARSVMKDNKESTKELRIDEYEEAIKRSDDEKKKHHAELVQKRFDVGPLIANELKSLLIKLDADRAAILEMHNGTNNASGLPFIYGDMVYEEISPRVGFASDEFKNFNLAKLPFVAIHYNDKTWIGPVDDVEKDDPYFAAKLRVVEVNFGAFVVLEGINGPLGFLTLFFKSETNHPSKAKIMAELNHSSQILSTLLDKVQE